MSASKVAFFGSFSDWNRSSLPIKDRLSSAQIGFSLPEGCIRGVQVHGTRVFDVESSPLSAPECDGLYLSRRFAREPWGIAVQTADCVPILGIDPSTQSRFALHAGWRGLVGGIISSAVKSIRNDDLNPSQFSVLIGPCIGPRKFEVGEDVLTLALKNRNLLCEVPLSEEKILRHFKALSQSSSSAPKWLMDLRSLTTECMLLSGFKSENIAVLNECTYENGFWPSYRRDGAEGIRLRKIYSSIYLNEI